MCGIFCLLSLSPTHLQLDKSVCERLKRRGPDASQELTITNANPYFHCVLSSHVLHMRGHLTPQPVQDDNGNVLVWNGEIFGGLTVTPEQNDTAVVSQRLSSCNSPSEILSVFSSIRGPWGFVYYQKDGDYLWFGRDFFGRRSLLWNFVGQVLILTSVAAHTSWSGQSSWHEVPAVGLYRIDMKAATECGTIKLEVYPWTRAGNCVVSNCIETVSASVPDICTTVMNDTGLALWSSVCPLNMSIPESLNEPEIHPNSHLSVKDLEQLLASKEKNDEVNCLTEVLSEAVRRRVQSLPFELRSSSSSNNSHASVAILFSGGLDSMILAALADRHVPAHQPIDLLNVAFKLQELKRQNECAQKTKKRHKNKAADPKSNEPGSQTSGPFDVPDRITGRAGLKELQDLNPDRRWNFVEINVAQEELQRFRHEHICHLVHPLDTVLDDSIGCAVWFASRGMGVIREGSGQKPFTSSAKVTYV